MNTEPGKDAKAVTGRPAEHSNLKKARIVFHDETGTWYGLDNAATIMPAVSDAVVTSLFRIQVTLDHEVDVQSLGQALANTARRFPYFNVELRRGFFWYYFEHNTAPLEVQSDSGSPCQDYNINNHGTPLFRIRSSSKVIAGEFSHALTDGSGGLRFMQTMLTEYFRLKGVDPGAEIGEGDYADIYKIDRKPHVEEYEDAYHRHFFKTLPVPDPGTGAFQIPTRLLPRYHYRVMAGAIPLDAALRKAKSYGVSLTELLAAAYIDALQEIWLNSTKKQKKRYNIGLEIPVNMRKFYPTRSNRNFSLLVILSQDMRLGKRAFEAIVERVHHQLRIENDERNIARQITRNVGGSRNIAVRLVPLFIKDFFSHILFSKFGENLISGLISNLGKIVMPPGPAAHIERFDFIPAPSRITATNASALSWKDTLYIDFGSLAESRELERLFFTRLRRIGLPVRVDCSLPGGL